MTDFPPKGPLPLFVSSYTRYFNAFTARNLGGISSPSTAAWFGANTAIYMPFALPFAYPVRRLFVGNGTAAGGNFSVGIYAPDGQGIYVSAGTAGSGNDLLQYVTPGTEFLLGPGRYFFGCSRDNTTANRLVAGGISSQHATKILGVLQQASAYPLPSTATFAIAAAITIWPLVGFTRTASGF